MSRGVIIHLDNDIDKVLNPSKNLFEQNDIDLEYIICQTKEEFAKIIEDNRLNIKALIFDLLGEKHPSDNLHKKDAEFLDSIKHGFACYNIPIFIYSGYLQALEGEFDAYGTVFKIEKNNSIQDVFDKIALFWKSGFINVFCPGGVLERELHKDLNLAFTKQFNNNEQIENIIKEIAATAKGETSNRVEKVFTRVAIRSMLSSLLAPETNEDGKIQPELVHPIEHYLQRISPFDFWTGDVFQDSKSDRHVLIITPRCDVTKKSDELLICEIEMDSFPLDMGNKDEKDRINYALNDKPEVSGYNRFLPPCPCFRGGKVWLSKYSIIKKEILMQSFIRIISLSDELTNEILGKFGAYFFRSGITPYNSLEAIAHIANIQPKKEDAKK